jgi:hypothetical protein
VSSFNDQNPDRGIETEEWEEHLYRGLGDAVEKQVDKLKEAQPAPPVFQAHVRAGTPVEV